MLSALKLTVAVCMISSLVCLVQSRGDGISYTYKLWIGDEVDEEHSLKLTSEQGIFFINAMDQAAALDSNFIYESIVHPVYGNFITKIAGHHRNEET